MEARPDPRVRNLFGKGPHFGPAVGYAGRRPAGHRNLGDICSSEHRLDDSRYGAAEDAMRARIFRVHRRVVDRLPGRLAIGARVAVNIAIANWRDWSPDVVMVIGIDRSNYRVVEADRYE